jgi:O-antigen ligase
LEPFAKNPRSLIWRVETFLCSYWLPVGFFVLMSGLFAAPNAHVYKVWMPYVLLLPCLLCMLTFRGYGALLRQYPALGLVTLYLLYWVFNARGSEDGALEYLHWSIYIFVFLFGVGVCMRISVPRFNQLLAAVCVFAGAAALYAIARDAPLIFVRDTEYRLTGYGTLYNPLRSGNLWGCFALMAFWCGFVLTRLRWMMWIASAICFAAIVFTGSRSPLLALAAVALLVVFSDLKKQKQMLALALVVLAGGVTLALFWGSLSVRGWSLRPQIWWQALQYCRAHIWLGAGIGNELQVQLSSGKIYYDTHNVFLATLYYGGFAGLILFLSVFVGSFWLSWRRRKNHALYYLAAILQLYGLVALQFDGGILLGRPSDFWMFYWMPIAIALYASRQPQAQKVGTAPGLTAIFHNTDIVSKGGQN